MFPKNEVSLKNKICSCISILKLSRIEALALSEMFVIIQTICLPLTPFIKALATSSIGVSEKFQFFPPLRFLSITSIDLSTMSVACEIAFMTGEEEATILTAFFKFLELNIPISPTF